MTVKQEADFNLEIPDGDDRERRVCRTCDFIDYQNPKIVAGSVITQDDKILMCKRAIEPRKGFWTLPAGFMELGESVEEAAAREAFEEAEARIEIDRVLAVYSVPRIGQVQIMFRARLIGGYGIGPESEETELLAWNDIPWSKLAFPTVVWALTHYAQTRTQTHFPPFLNPPGTDGLTR